MRAASPASIGELMRRYQVARATPSREWRKRGRGRFARCGGGTASAGAGYCRCHPGAGCGKYPADRKWRPFTIAISFTVLHRLSPRRDSRRRQRIVGHAGGSSGGVEHVGVRYAAQPVSGLATERARTVRRKHLSNTVAVSFRMFYRHLGAHDVRPRLVVFRHFGGPIRVPWIAIS